MISVYDERPIDDGLVRRTTLLKAVLDDALNGEATDPIVYNGLPYLALVTDEELKYLYSQAQAWVDGIRVKALNLLDAKSTLDNYSKVVM